MEIKKVLYLSLIFVIGCTADSEKVIKESVSEGNTISYAVINRPESDLSTDTFIEFYLSPDKDSSIINSFKEKRIIFGGDNSRIYFSEKHEIVRVCHSNKDDNLLTTYAPSGVLLETTNKLLIGRFELSLWDNFRTIDSLYAPVFSDDFYIKCFFEDNDSIKFIKSDDFQIYYKYNGFFIDKESDSYMMDFKWSMNTPC